MDWDKSGGGERAGKGLLQEHRSQQGLELGQSCEGELIVLVITLMVPHSISAPSAFKQIVLFNFYVNSIKKGLLSFIC